jgi:hypothetical protein
MATSRWYKNETGEKAMRRIKQMSVTGLFGIFDPAWKRCSFLLVEGTSDRTFYARLIDATMCSVEVANGKQQALDVLRILNN